MPLCVNGTEGEEGTRERQRQRQRVRESRDMGAYKSITTSLIRIHSENLEWLESVGLLQNEARSAMGSRTVKEHLLGAVVWRGTALRGHRNSPLVINDSSLRPSLRSPAHEAPGLRNQGQGASRSRQARRSHLMLRGVSMGLN
eukprot:767193-Hanusia_phi.AAC.4